MSNEPTRSKKVKRKRKWPKVLAFCGTGVILGVVLAAGALYWNFSPTHHFSIQKTPVVVTPKGKTVKLHSGEFNILVFGIDSYTPGQAGHTDSIVVAHVNLRDHKYSVLSVSRDSRVYLPGYGYTKITHANFMAEANGGTVQTGAKDAIQAVSNLTGLPINYYAETNFWGLKDIIDSLGGIDMYVPFDVPLQQSLQVPGYPTVITKGNHYLTGQVVLNMSRERMTLAQGDFGRQQLQEEALIAIAKKLAQPSEASKIPSVVNTLSKFIVTSNMTQQDMISMALGLKGFSSSQVHYYQVPGKGGQFMDPILHQVLDYWVVDQPGLNKIIAEHFEN